MKKADWLPSKKDEQLAMAKNWVNTLSAKHLEWSIPPSRSVTLNEATAAAEVENSIPAGERNKITSARLKAAFNTLTAEMRDIKKRYFFIPPLTEADLIGLGLKPKDNTPTPIGVPKMRAVGKVIYKGAGLLDLLISPDSDISDDPRAYHGCKVLYTVLDTSAKPPESEKELTESLFTRRKKESFIFQPKDSARRIYFCLRYENSKGQAGPWCPIFSAIIP